MMAGEVEAAVERMRAYLLQTATRPEWAGWLKVARALAPHSGTDGGKTDDSYRWESKIALWGSVEQWRQVGYEVGANAKPRLVLAEASEPKGRWELIYSEKEVAGGPYACALRVPRGSKTPAKAPEDWMGPEPAGAIKTLETLLMACGWKVYRRPDARGADAYCKFVEKEIWVQRSGDLWTDFHRLAHESGHALLHQPEASKASLWQGEIEAEGVAMLWGEILGVDIAEASAKYILYRSTGHPSEMVDFRVEEVAFSDRTIGVVEAGLEMIQDLESVTLAHVNEVVDEYDSM